MPTYTDSTRVYTELPDNLPTSVTNYTDTDIASASQIVESKVGAAFPLAYKNNAQKFPDITDTPSTPGIVELAARYYAASLQYKRLEQVAGEGETPKSSQYWDMAESIVKDIREGISTVEVDGATLGSTQLAAVEDPQYKDRVEPKEFFNPDDLDTHWP